MQHLQLADDHHMFTKSGIEAALMQTVHDVEYALGTAVFFSDCFLCFF
jgi:hypothetical protein